ncbi:MAG: polysaccharide pyruvyl transferase family protein [Rhodobacteraceae bacterium]|nr:polysaccharide pyruvyl transferase family protein [Paracoccaceae bacterium]
MAHFAFQHLRTTPNIGDRVATPARWLDFGPDITVQDFGAQVPPCDVAVFGGGQVYNEAAGAVLYRSAAARRRVVWGIGMLGVNRETARHDVFTGAVDLMGCRDVGMPGTVHVPCASCMAPRLASPPPPRHELVIYAHASKSRGLQRPSGIPCATNHGGTFAQAVDFIGSGATVVTNSYHGTYWALLLGRRVLCLPYSEKFAGFAQPPAMADAADWLAALPKAWAADGYLEECRALTAEFHARVLALA